LAALPVASTLSMPAPKRRRDQPPTIEEKIAEAEIRALLAEDAQLVDSLGVPVVRMPWAPVVEALHRAWPEKSKERDDVEAVLKWVCRGLYRETAFLRVGLRPSMGTTWNAKAAKGDRRYQLVKELMEMADGVAEAQAITVIERAARKDWRAAAWYLDRKYPERWGTGAMRAPHQHMNTTRDPRFNGQAPAGALINAEHPTDSTPLLPPLPPSEFEDEQGAESVVSCGVSAKGRARKAQPKAAE
jgi:hypothetical protein